MNQNSALGESPRVTGVNHLAFITEDMERTIRFYRDLLGMELVAGIGHDGYRHYFFKFGDAQIAFFEYDGARPMEYKFHGVMTNKPLGFDHLSLTVESKEDLFAFKDRLEAAGVEVTGAIDHGTIWSIYFFDHNVIPLEISWECMEMLVVPAMSEDDPMDIVAEGSGPQPGVWPAVTKPTPPAQMVASPGNGLPMRETFLREGKARLKDGFPAAAE
ncbi:MAG TPA: VOC family protein [Sneathiellales bacterium]|jgi:catechol 2,3-dioxygenase-like lactoylglutathione lyase family enzyme|nr:VOC family protein [Sneathiellales bacterium]